MFKLRTLELLILICIIGYACAPKTLPPELKPSYEANEVLLRIQELQTTVINLNHMSPPGVTKDRADKIVEWTTTSAKAIKNTLAGDWKTTVKEGWNTLKKQIGIPESGLQSTWLLVDYIISTL